MLLTQVKTDLNCGGNSRLASKSFTTATTIKSTTPSPTIVGSRDHEKSRSREKNPKLF